MLILLLSLFYSCPVTHQRFVTDNCDWLDSVSLTSTHGVRLIRPVFLRCAEGRVQWRYPANPLKIVLTIGTSGKDFTGCVRIRHSGNARILVQNGNAELRPVLKAIDCFRSFHGQTVLYIEPTATSGYSNRLNIDFNYQLFNKKYNDIDYDKQISDCAPCNDEQLIRLFCSCDYAARGRLLQAKINRKLGVTEVEVAASRVYKQSSSVFGGNSSQLMTGIVHFNLNCQVKSGSKGGREDYVLIGQLVLGYARVLCAPRWTHWTTTAQQHRHNAECQLPIN
ncbi:hypothetical protein CHUAL_003136 [Chamberlinius hualienensis]